MTLASTLSHSVAVPLRIGLSAGELVLEVALGVVRGTRRALEHSDGGGDVAESSLHRFETAVPDPGEAPTLTSAPAPAAAPPAPVVPASAVGDALPVVPPPPGAKQVDDSATPVGEFGGEGAKEPVGAEIHVDPPWDGYDELTAAQITQRLSTADQETVAAVLLYEGSRRGRKSVVGAAQKRLKLLSAGQW